jgi:hypothetical protein
MHPFRVEELVGRDKQAISRGQEARGVRSTPVGSLAVFAALAPVCLRVSILRSRIMLTMTASGDESHRAGGMSFRPFSSLKG